MVDRFHVVGAVVGVVSGLAAAGQAGAAAATQTAPVSQPADEIVLVRLGDGAVITQGDFERTIARNPAQGWEFRDRVLLYIAQQRWMELYVRDHPDLAPEPEVEAYLAGEAKAAGFDSVEALRRSFGERQWEWEGHCRNVRIRMAKKKLSDAAFARARDETTLKAIFEARRIEFDLTYVTARQIFFASPVYEPSDRRQAKRQKLARMREDILSGKRTWEQCVAESDSASDNGRMGDFTRHQMQNEVLAEAAFKLKPGEISDVVATVFGDHLIQVLDITTPSAEWDDIRKRMARWIQTEDTANALIEAMKKYPLVGVQAPRPPTTTAPATATAPAGDAAPRGSTRKPVFFGGPLTQPARPGAKTRPATAPAIRPAGAPRTRPAPAGRPASREVHRGKQASPRGTPPP